MPTKRNTQETAPAAAGAPKSNPPGGQARAVALAGSTAVALPPELAEELAGAAKDAAAVERPKLSKISFKSGMMSYMQTPVPGDFMDMILLATAHRNTWYAGAYDQDNIVNPTCFAIKASRDDETEMIPHENVKEPVHATCEGCPKNAWGSAMRDGKPSRGKACKEGRRILVIPAAVLDAADPIQALKTAEKAVIDVPVTSVGNYGNFVNALNATVQRPMWSVITRVQVVRDVRTQFKVTFTPMNYINDTGAIRALRSMLEDAERIVTLPYDETELAGKEPEPVKPNKFTKARAKA